MNAEYNVQPDDIFFVDPFAVTIPDDCDQRDATATDAITTMAVSLHTHGQRRPVECRMMDDNSLLLVHGRTRTAAARLIRTGFRHFNPESQTDTKIKNRRFKLKVVITGANNDEASNWTATSSPDAAGSR